MKYTTVIAAGLAAGVSADDWNTWSSAAATSTTSADVEATYCPAKVTQTVTQTADCAEVTSEIYKTTITVTAPEVETVTVYADGKTAGNPWEEWTYTSEKPAPTKLPHGCVPKVETETETAWAKKAGSTTTVTKSTLFVGAGQKAEKTITITATGNAPAATWNAAPVGSDNSGSGAPVDSDSGSGNWGGNAPSSDNAPDGDNAPDSDNGNWNGWSGDNDGPSFYDGPDGVKIPVGNTIGQATWIFEVPDAPSSVKSWDAPTYTQQPDGSYGYHWGDWPGSDGGNGGNGGKDGSGKNNGTTGPGLNATAGSPGSNVTKPIQPLNSWAGNNAGDRSQWVNGKNINSDYYQDYFSGKRCTADLTLSRKTLNLDGTPREMIVFNGQYPGPLIECNWGDIIEVTVHNAVPDNGTSIHWHGFRQYGTNDQDGVPGITECPIAPGGSKKYVFHASSYGSSWYHSHWISQYGDGAFGPILIHGPATADYDYDMGPVMISDVFNLTAAQQNYQIAHFGQKNTRNYLLNGHNTAFDLSGGQHTLWEVESGKKYLFRFVNSAAQNMFSVSLDNHTMEVIAADFVPIKPYTTQWLNIGIGQRYDVVIEMDQKVDSYFLRAVTQTLCPSQCDNTGLGNANGIVAYKGVQTTPYLLPTTKTTKTPADFRICLDEPLASLVPFVPKGAGTSSAFAASESTLPVGAPTQQGTPDDGSVFFWTINKYSINVNYTQPTLKTLDEGKGLNTTLISNPIVLNQKDQWVYFVIQNQFAAAHPMHLHGHDFAILGQGYGNFQPNSQAGTLNFDNPMRRDTAMLQGAKLGSNGAPLTVFGPTGYTVIGFETDNPGAWLMHCHIIWHVDGGLALQWIERPDDIPVKKYVDQEFKQECKAYTTYEAQNPDHKKTSGSAGLKRSPVFDEQVRRIEGYHFDDVVRRDGGAKHYLDTHMKRGLGDGAHRRHFGRK